MFFDDRARIAIEITRMVYSTGLILISLLYIISSHAQIDTNSTILVLDNVSYRPR